MRWRESTENGSPEAQEMFEVRQGLCKVKWRCWLTMIFADLGIMSVSWHLVCIESVLLSPFCSFHPSSVIFDLSMIQGLHVACPSPWEQVYPIHLCHALLHLETSNMERFIFSHKPSCMYSILSAQTFLSNCPEGQCEESGSSSSQLSILAASVVLWIALLQFLFF